MSWPSANIGTVGLTAGTFTGYESRHTLRIFMDTLNEVIAGRNVANGVAGLDANTTIPLEYLPVPGNLTADFIVKMLVLGELWSERNEG